MRDLAFLSEPPPTEAVLEIDPTDPRIGDLGSLAEKRDAAGVAAIAESIFDEGIRDVRVITFYLWASFATNGPAALAACLDVLVALGTFQFERVSPEKRRAEHLARRVTWFCQRVIDGIDYHEKKASPDWKRWQAEVLPESLQEALSRITLLDASLAERLGASPPSVPQLGARIRSLAAVLTSGARAPEPAAHGETAMPPPVRSEDIDADRAPSPAVRESVAPVPGMVGLRPSHHYFELVAKLAAFRALVERREWMKAAIVSDDVTRLIDEFDPRVYFPELFSDYSELLSQHIDELAERWQQRDSLAWKTTAQFYRVDLRRFSGLTRMARRDPEAQARFEARVVAMAPRFDLKSLVDLLTQRGYAREQILFQANPETPTSSGVVERLELRRRAPRFAVITVNMALLGDGSLLPSYVVRAVERSRNPEVFQDFIRFFDHRLVANFLAGVWPEDDPAVHPDYRATGRALLAMGGFGSIAAVHVVAAAAWPELSVRVSRGSFAEPTAAHGTRAGYSRLDGSTVIGRTFEADASGFAIDLTAEEETDSRGRAWAALVRKRFEERVLPVVGEFRVPLHVRLRVLVHASWAHLDTVGGATGYLGYDRVAGDPEAGHVVTIFRGVTTAAPTQAA